MKKKTRVAILCGGKSAEHEISLQSAKNIFEAIDRKKYEVLLIGISKKGQWTLIETSRKGWPKSIPSIKADKSLVLAPGRKMGPLVGLSGREAVGRVGLPCWDIAKVVSGIVFRPAGGRHAAVVIRDVIPPPEGIRTRIDSVPSTFALRATADRSVALVIISELSVAYRE